MAGKRKAIALDIERQVLHESGYKCGNPTCHRILTLDIHHIVEVGVGGPNDLHNLLALCPNCHALHHRQKVIPIESIRAWKMLLLAINEAYDRRSVRYCSPSTKQETCSSQATVSSCAQR